MEGRRNRTSTSGAVAARRALFAIPSLRCGGAERVFTLVLNGLAELGFDMHVALCQCEGYWLSRLSSRVTVHDLESRRVRSAGWKLTQLVRRLRPETVLSTSLHFNTLAGLFRPLFPAATRLLVREVSVSHLDPSAIQGLRGRQVTLQGLAGALVKRGYRAADRVICLTDGMRELVQDRMGLPPERTVRIFNPSEVQVTAATRAPRTSGRRLVCIGSLTEPKGMDRAIAAFSTYLRHDPTATLTIHGEGCDRADLERRIADLGLEQRVLLPGFCVDVPGALADADLFVLPSRFEGMPNALLEAIGAGCPVVALEHPGGTREVLDILGLADRITPRLEDWRPEWFAPLPATTASRTVENFGLDSIVAQYAAVIFPDVAAAQRAA